MTATTERTRPTEDVNARRARGAVLIIGGLVLWLLIDVRSVPYYWFPAITGATYLVGAAVSRSRGGLWTPGLMIGLAGLAIALWFRDMRPIDLAFVGYALLALGLGAVLAIALGQNRGFTITGMNIAVVLLLFGGFVLLVENGFGPFKDKVWPFAALLGLWGIIEIVRPTTTSRS